MWTSYSISKFLQLLATLPVNNSMLGDKWMLVWWKCLSELGNTTVAHTFGVWWNSHWKRLLLIGRQFYMLIKYPSNQSCRLVGSKQEVLVSLHNYREIKIGNRNIILHTATTWVVNDRYDSIHLLADPVTLRSDSRRFNKIEWFLVSNPLFMGNLVQFFHSSLILCFN